MIISFFTAIIISGCIFMVAFSQGSNSGVGGAMSIVFVFSIIFMSDIFLLRRKGNRYSLDDLNPTLLGASLSLAIVCFSKALELSGSVTSEYFALSISFLFLLYRSAS